MSCLNHHVRSLQDNLLFGCARGRATASWYDVMPFHKKVFNITCSDFSRQALPLCSCELISLCTGVVDCKGMSFFASVQGARSEYFFAQYENGTMALAWWLTMSLGGNMTTRPHLTFYVSGAPPGYTMSSGNRITVRNDVAPLLSDTLEANFLSDAMIDVGSRVISVAERNAICLKMASIKLVHGSESATTNITGTGNLWPPYLSHSTLLTLLKKLLAVLSPAVTLDI